MKLIIDRKTWLRGEGSDDSRLVRSSDNKKCCLGFLGEQCGIPLEKMKDRFSFGRDHLDESCAVDLPSAMKFLVNDSFANPSHDAINLMSANDEKIIIGEGKFKYESEREVFLTEEFKKHGIEVEFIN